MDTDKMFGGPTDAEVAQFLKEWDEGGKDRLSQLEEARRAFEQFAQCDFNEGNCASLEPASKRIRNIANKALAALTERKEKVE